MTTKNETQHELWSFTQDLNSEPSKDAIRKNDDGSLYLPISYVQTLLDSVFLGQWNFEVTSTVFGRRWARGSGVMEVVHPITGNKIKRSGDAAIILTGNLRTDSPRLEAMILLSCAKKYGKVFGRDLNRIKDDAPLQAIRQVEKSDPTTEEKRMQALINDCDDIAELQTYKLVVPASLKKEYESKIKMLSSK
jgi:hypothetical protein